MLITFIGNPLDKSDIRESVTIGGTTFELDVCIEVAEDAAFAKLRLNSHFRVEADVAIEVTLPPEMLPSVTQGHSLKDQRIAEAEKHGVAFDRRWGEPRITEALRAHFADAAVKSAEVK